ncbi:uncharacterized protein, partial [Nicotiana sylvestris]|uniref:uncharacterized protein n=1 Tax=Nicotiana sylvestris TaxID=4096 RepID=UPI00388C4E58
MVMNRKIIQLLLVLFLCLIYDGVRGTKLSDEQEDLELEMQLERLNKPAIKTIKTEYSDIYDCVDFYKQPAFDHPLLKNHNYHPQMNSLFVKESDSTMSTSNKLPGIRLADGGCPVGTVPIRRTTKEDLIRHKLLPPPEDIMVDSPLTYRENSIDSKKRRYKPLQGYKLAIIHTADNPNNKFGGGAMTTSVYNPHVEDQQHSACRLKIIKGTNIIQVGWRVDPTLYGDNATRLYIHFQNGTNACFNLLCPAFVLVNREVVIDGALNPVSQRGEKIFEMRLSINWDQNKGNWWLFSTDTNIPIGFWPREVFDDFDYFATRVEWGGVVYSPPGIREPSMGSGFSPIRDTLYDAFCRNITLLSDKGDNINVGQLPIYANGPNLYNAIDIPNGGDYFKHVMVYGGPVCFGDFSKTMSQSSSSLNRSIWRCRCGLAANYFMVWTPLNAGRRFFKCPKHEDEKYSYWEWQDEEVPPRISNLMCSLKKKKEALICERNVLQRKVADLENVMMLVDHGGIESLELKMIMNRKIIEQFLFMLYLCSSYDGVRGRKLPNQDKLELEKRLKLLNKPAIKTIKTKFGDIYDCVDFYKQPAFDHLLLKNHNYHPQMKPSLFVKESDSTMSTSNKLSGIELPDGGCPVGTVPIRRTTKEDLIRHKLMPPAENVMVDSPLTHRENSIDSKRRRYKPLQGYKIATVHTDDDNPNNKFGGASMAA